MDTNTVNCYCTIIDLAVECAKEADDNLNVPDGCKAKFEQLKELCKEVVDAGEYEQFWKVLSFITQTENK